ncbi:hypothetical protein AB1N83_013806, partial [Pleurotus pulmonarius]
RFEPQSIPPEEIKQSDGQK